MDYNKDNTRRRPMACTEEHYISEYNRIFGIKDKKDTEVEKSNNSSSGRNRVSKT